MLQLTLSLPQAYSASTKPERLCKHRQHRNTADAKQAKNSTHNSTFFYVSVRRTSSSIRNCRSHRAGGGISFEVFWSPFCLETSWPFHVKEFLQPVFQHSIGKASIFSTCMFLFSSYPPHIGAFGQDWSKQPTA